MAPSFGQGQDRVALLPCQVDGILGLYKGSEHSSDQTDGGLALPTPRDLAPARSLSQGLGKHLLPQMPAAPNGLPGLDSWYSALGTGTTEAEQSVTGTLFGARRQT